MDIESFSDDSFDVVEWINSNYRNSKCDDKKVFISSFVSKLQLYVQQVNFAVEDVSNQALSNMHRVIKDVKTLDSEIKTLQSQMNEVREEFIAMQKETGNSMEVLEKLNDMQIRLQSAKESLQESDGWGNLLSQLEDGFERNDLSAICEKLVSLQKSLVAQEKLAGHAERAEQVEDFKNRLEAIASPVIVHAFASGNIEKSQNYAQIFSSINRTSQLMQYYRAVQKNTIQQKWKEMLELTNCVTTLLNSFYEYLVEFCQKQTKWCLQVFGEKYTSEPLIAMTEVFSSLEPTREMVLARFLKTSSEKLQLLESVCEANKKFATAISTYSKSSQKIYESIFSYFLQFIKQYPKLEEQSLSVLLLSTELKESANPIDAIRSLEHGNSKIFEWLQTAAERCSKITDNYGILDLIPLIGETIKTFIDNYVKTVRKINLSINSEQNWNLMQNCLTILQNLSDIQNKVSKLSKGLADKVLSLNETTKSDNYYRIYLKTLKLNDTFKYQDKVKEFNDSAAKGDVYAVLYPAIAESLKSIFIEAHDSTLTILIYPIEEQLKNIKLMETSSNITNNDDLPSFSYAPQECITQVGQYLLTLPQHLEPLLLSPSNLLKSALEICNVKYTQSIPCADVLLSLVVEQCCFLYQNRILQLKSLSNADTKQLTVDIDYLKNIIDELGLTPTIHLTQISTLLKASPENYLALSAGCEPRLVTAIRQMRNIISME